MEPAYHYQNIAMASQTVRTKVMNQMNAVVSKKILNFVFFLLLLLFQNGKNYCIINVELLE